MDWMLIGSNLILDTTTKFGFSVLGWAWPHAIINGIPLMQMLTIGLTNDLKSSPASSLKTCYKYNNMICISFLNQIQHMQNEVKKKLIKVPFSLIRN